MSTVHYARPHYNDQGDLTGLASRGGHADELSQAVMPDDLHETMAWIESDRAAAKAADDLRAEMQGAHDALAAAFPGYRAISVNQNVVLFDSGTRPVATCTTEYGVTVLLFGGGSHGAIANTPMNAVRKLLAAVAAADAIAVA